MKITKTIDGNAAMLSLGGRLDASSAPLLTEELKQLSKNVTDLVFDLEELEYASTTGLRVFLVAQDMMSRRGSFTVIRPGSDVMDLLRTTGLAERIEILL